MRILMLEDNDSRITMIEERCKARGWEFTYTKKVEEFAELIHASAYDVVLLDHDLGYEKTGIDAVGCLIAEQGNRARVYVHSANCVRAPEMVRCLRENFFKAHQIDFLSLWTGMKDLEWTP